MIEPFGDIVNGKSVALVGNAASLLDQGKAAEIDAHDIVIRINMGLPEVLGATRVGRKTDIWVTARYFPEVDPRQFRLTVWMKLTSLGNKEWREMCLSDRGAEARLVRWPQELADECMTFCQCDPGCGLRILWLLKKKLSPSNVRIFGMDCWETASSWNPDYKLYHRHDGNQERKVIDQLCSL